MKASEELEIKVDGRAVRATPAMTVAAALHDSGQARLRASVTGEPRGVLCAMGICFECRVTIDGIANRRACLVLCRPGLEVETGG